MHHQVLQLRQLRSGKRFKMTTAGLTITLNPHESPVGKCQKGFFKTSLQFHPQTMTLRMKMTGTNRLQTVPKRPHLKINGLITSWNKTKNEEPL